MVFQDPYHEIYQDSLVITLSEAVTPRLQLFSCCREVYQIATLFANISTDLVLVANPPRATTSVFLSHLSWQPSSRLTTPLNLQYWEEDRTSTPVSEAEGESPEVITVENNKLTVFSSNL